MPPRPRWPTRPRAADPAALPESYFRELSAKERPQVDSLAGLTCYDTEFGWIFCGSPTQARSMAEDVRGAAAAFQRYFGVAPVRGAVVTVSNNKPPPWATLERAGADWTMPWFDAAAIAAFDQKVADQRRDQLAGAGKAGPAVDHSINQMLAATHGGFMQGDGILRHELGHVWFVEAFWGRAAMHRLSSSCCCYAGPAHDWLDETAAILMENDQLTAHRRKEFKDALKGDPGRIHPLGDFFTMIHPMLARTPVPQAADIKTTEADVKLNKRGSAHVSVDLTAPGDEKKPKPILDFYSQCRGFIDFMHDKTGRDDVFRSISENEAKGGDMAGWLLDNGRKFGLPVSVDDLDRQFQAWAKGR